MKLYACIAIWPSIMLRMVTRMPVTRRPDSWKIILLIALGTFRKFLFRLLRSPFVTDLEYDNHPLLMGLCKTHLVSKASVAKREIEGSGT